MKNCNNRQNLGKRRQIRVHTRLPTSQRPSRPMLQRAISMACMSYLHFTSIPSSVHAFSPSHFFDFRTFKTTPSTQRKTLNPSQPKPFSVASESSTICNAKLNKLASSFDLDEILNKEKEFDSAEDVSSSSSSGPSSPKKGKRKGSGKTGTKKLKELLKKQQIEEQRLRLEQKQEERGEDLITNEKWRLDDEEDVDESEIDREALLQSIRFSAFEVPPSLDGKRIDTVLVDLINEDFSDRHDKEMSAKSNSAAISTISRSQCGTLLSNECVFVVPPDAASDFQSAREKYLEKQTSGDTVESDKEGIVPHDLLRVYGGAVQRKSLPLESRSILIYPSRSTLFPTSSTSSVVPSTILSLLSNSLPPTEIIPQNIPLDILFEDESIIVLNKQAGMVVHPAAGNWDGTVVNALAHYLKFVSPFGAGEFFEESAAGSSAEDGFGVDASNDAGDIVRDLAADMKNNGKHANKDDVINSFVMNGRDGFEEDPTTINKFDAVTNSIPTLRPGIVHRLDKGTTGVLVVAKTRAALAALSEAFADRRVKKQYVAIAIGHPGEDVWIDKPIGRHPLHRQKMRVVPDHEGGGSQHRQNRLTGRDTMSASRQGRHALSHVNTIYHDGKLSIVQVRIATGRTHQIRVHLQDRGTPIYGDDVYGLSDWNRALSARRGITRPLLHAQRLEVDHPVTGERMVFVAKVAEDMMGVMEGIWPGDEVRGMFG